MIGVDLHSWGSRWTELTPDEWVELRTAIDGLPEQKPNYVHNTVYCDYDALRILVKLNLGFTLKAGPDAMIVRLLDRVSALEARVHDSHQMAAQLKSGGAVVIHIPNNRLTHYNEVNVLEDACTNDLQDYLDKGWRILAVCPPNSQRRPDYIVGRRRPA